MKHSCSRMATALWHWNNDQRVLGFSLTWVRIILTNATMGNSLKKDVTQDLSSIKSKTNTIVFPSFVSDTKSLGRTLSDANCFNSDWYACTLLYQWVPWQISDGCCQLNGEWGRDSTADWWTMTGAASLLVDGGGSCCKQSSTKKRCQESRAVLGATPWIHRVFRNTQGK